MEDIEYVQQHTTHYCSDYDMRTTKTHIVRRGTDSSGYRLTLCGERIVDRNNSFKGALTCIGRDHWWGTPNTEECTSLWSYVTDRENCSDCLERAVQLAVDATAMPEQDAEVVEA